VTPYDSSREPPATLWIDTNVMNEILGQGDLHRDAWKGPAAIEGRRLRLQGSLWLAMALDERRDLTMSFEHETVRNSLRLVPPDSEVAFWTIIPTYILAPYVFSGWRGHMTKEGQEIGSSSKRDAFIVQRCSERNMMLISRDNRGVIKRARAAGRVQYPEEYAAQVLTLDAARRRFMDRLELGVLHYIVNCGVTGRWLRTVTANMELALRVYLATWQT
jgi:hypothetical protein